MWEFEFRPEFVRVRWKSLLCSALPSSRLQSLRQTHAGQPRTSKEEQRQKQEDKPQATGRQEQVKTRQDGDKRVTQPAKQTLHVPFYFSFFVY